MRCAVARPAAASRRTAHRSAPDRSRAGFGRRQTDVWINTAATPAAMTTRSAVIVVLPILERRSTSGKKHFTLLPPVGDSPGVIAVQSSDRLRFREVAAGCAAHNREPAVATWGHALDIEAGTTTLVSAGSYDAVALELGAGHRDRRLRVRKSHRRGRTERIELIVPRRIRVGDGFVSEPITQHHGCGGNRSAGIPLVTNGSGELESWKRTSHFTGSHER